MSHFFTDMHKKYDNKRTKLLTNIKRELENGKNVNIKKKYDEAIDQLKTEWQVSLNGHESEISIYDQPMVDVLFRRLLEQRESLSPLSNAIQKAEKGEKVNASILEKIATEFEQINQKTVNELNHFNLAKNKRLNHNAVNRIDEKVTENRIKHNYLNLAGRGGGKKIKAVKGKKKKAVKGKKKVRKIHTGPKGGKYYISKGKKIYI